MGKKKTRPGLAKLDLFMEGGGSFFVSSTKPGLKQHPAFFWGDIILEFKEFPLPSALLCQVLEATHSEVFLLQKILFPPTLSGCGRLVTLEPGLPPPLVTCAQMGTLLHQQEPAAPSLLPEIHGAASLHVCLLQEAERSCIVKHGQYHKKKGAKITLHLPRNWGLCSGREGLQGNQQTRNVWISWAGTSSCSFYEERGDGKRILGAFKITDDF